MITYENYLLNKSCLSCHMIVEFFKIIIYTPLINNNKIKKDGTSRTGFEGMVIMLTRQQLVYDTD